MRRLPTSLPSVVRPMVTYRKLSKIGPQLLWNAIRKWAPLILLPYSDPLQTLRPLGNILVLDKICSNINTVACSTSRQITVVVDRVRPS